MKDAIEQVKLGKAWAAIYLPENFTTDLLHRVCAIYPSKCPPNFGNITEETINGSSVHIYADVTSKTTGYKVEPLNKGHSGASHFVRREVVLSQTY